MADDLIRRRDAIKAIDELPNAYNGWSDSYDKAYIIGTLEEVPRAEQTEPQTDIHDLTDCDFCKDRICKDCEGGKDEPQTERSE